MLLMKDARPRKRSRLRRRKDARPRLRRNARLQRKRPKKKERGLSSNNDSENSQKKR